MNQKMRDKKAYWIGGTLIAILGVALVRLVAPELSGGWASMVLLVGLTLVVAGITTITFGTKRDPSDAYIEIEKR